MGRVLEDDAKRILRGFGVDAPHGSRAATADEAAEIAASLGNCVVKALVPAGRRGKAGLVAICAGPATARAAASRMLGQSHDGHRVEMVLVEQQIEIASEHYLSISIDAAAYEIALLLSATGGVDVEDQAERVLRVGINPLAVFDVRAAEDAWRSAGLPAIARALGEATERLLTAFRALDATLLEINPLAVDGDARVVAVGAMLAIDDLASERQPEVRPYLVAGSDRTARPETKREQRVAEINADHTERGSARYLELDGGDIGFLCGGGGASLLLFDALVDAGGRPANYSEFGGNPTENRVYELTRVVLDKPGVRGLFVAHNITNNTQVDVVARGVTRALRDADVPGSFPVVAREVGVNDEEGKAVFEAAGVHYLGIDVSLNRAANQMVARMRETTLL